MTAGFRIRLRAGVIGAAALLLLTAKPTQAWEVNAPDEVITRVRPTPQTNWPFRPGYFDRPEITLHDYYFDTALPKEQMAPFSDNGLYRFDVRYIHEAHGGPVGSGTLPVAPGFMRCEQFPQDGDLDAAKCVPWEGAENGLPWVRPRKVWTDPDPAHADQGHDEHAALARAAAIVAGLPPTLSQTFFVRYPAANRLLATSVHHNGRPSDWIVGPTALPLDFSAESSSTVRGYTLYELSQMPDTSFSVADWAGSNETCPLDGLDWGFSRHPNDASLTRCHDYTATIGPLNATHFLPLSKNVYEYYHQLALSRMQECSRMSYWLSDAYPKTGPWIPVYSTSDTEVHECEREAMVYEMFAQHFLQDAWSTGHMWHRWGGPEPESFPALLDDRYGIKWDDPDAVPTDNLAGRRSAIAGVIAAFVGMVHGTKGITGIDDPLNFPLFLDVFSTPTPVQWMGLDGLPHPGAGDLYSRFVLSDDSDFFQSWRGHLLMCSAASMRAVYESGPKAHGPLSAFQSQTNPDEFDFEHECWSQRVTNDSMLGSVLPVPLSYFTPTPAILPLGAPAIIAPIVGPALFAIANRKVIPVVADLPNLPAPIDQAKFLFKLEQRMLLDEQAVVFDYLANLTEGGAQTGQYGTESARGIRLRPIAGNTDIRFLGVGPNKERTGSPPVATMDLPEPAVPEGDRPSSYFVRRMFWRGHPEDTCSVPGLAAQLRAACIAGSEKPGGDPEACTKCVSVAELQMPTCYLDSPHIGPSKCTALGYPNMGGVDPAFGTQDCSTQMSLSGLPAYYSAFHYCTGTDAVQFEENRLVGVKGLSGDQQIEVDCNKYRKNQGYLDTRYQYYVPRARIRYAMTMNENEWEGRFATREGYFSSSNFLPPFVNAVVDDRKFVMLSEAAFCHGDGVGNAQFFYSREESSLEPVVAGLISPLSFWDSFAHGTSTIPSFEFHKISPLQFEPCGLTQRVSYHNRDCPTALSSLGRSDLAKFADHGLDLASGVEVTSTIGDDDMRCSIREERYLKTKCFAGQCNANGLCSSRPRAEVTRFDNPAPP